MTLSIFLSVEIYFVMLVPIVKIKIILLKDGLIIWLVNTQKIVKSI